MTLVPNTSKPLQFPLFSEVMQIDVKPHKCPRITVKILGYEIEALADTGAAVTILNSPELVHKLGLQIHNVYLKIKTADGTAHRCTGGANVPYTYGRKTIVIPTVIVEGISQKLILGMNFLNMFEFELRSPLSEEPTSELSWCRVMEDPIHFNYVENFYGETEDPIIFTLIPENINSQQAQTNQEIDFSLELPTLDYPENAIRSPEDIETEHRLTESQRVLLFKVVKTIPCTSEGNLGRTRVIEHTIELLPDVNSRRKHPMYKYSPAVEREVDIEIDRMKSLGVIEECHGPVDFLNPILPVKKSSGKWRICLDSRGLNQVTKRDDFPFPSMTNILHRVKKSKYFSIIDLSESYYQVPLEKNSKNKTAFRTGKGLYRFTVMPFGLTNAPATMARLITKVLGHDLEPFVFTYLDDTIVATEDFATHIKMLEIIGKRFKAAGLTINIQKTKFCQTTIKYLGYVLSEDGLSIDPAKIQPVLDYPTPKSVKDIRRLLGLAGFYQKFIPSYSDITAPISDLLKKGKKVLWSNEADVAFNKLKSALVSAPILANPNFDLPFIIETDSSDQAIGAVLTQIQDGDRKCLAFFSKKLSATQRRYSATERECLAVLLSIENFKHFVEGTRFIVQTDAMSLTFLRTMSIESKSPRIARWALKLSKYDVTFEYRKGTENVSADFLSRGVHQISMDHPDAYIAGLREQIIKYPDRFKDFQIMNGKIYKYITNTSDLEDTGFRWKYVVPAAERREIMKQVHEEAHLGFVKTLGKIREKYYWPKMSIDIKRYCSNCEVCKESKIDNVNCTPPCGKRKLCSRPWEMISIDFLGPYPRSKKGNIWCLVVSDFYSKFVMVQCMRSATTQAVCTFLENMVFLVFGVPSICISDNAAVFTSKLFENLLKSYQVTHWNLAVYHPGPNPTERVNRVIVTAIRCSLNKKDTHKEWDENVNRIAMAIRTSVHDSTGYTPYFLNFGRNMISSGDEYENLKESEDKNTMANFRENQKKLAEIVQNNLKNAYHKYAKHYNLRSNVRRQFQEGEIVFKKNIHQSDKSKNFVGKFANKFTKVRIKEKVGYNTFILESLNGERIPGTYHASFLKKA